MKVTKAMREAEARIAFAMGKAVAKGFKLNRGIFGCDIVCTAGGFGYEARGNCRCAIGAYLECERPMITSSLEGATAAKALGVPRVWAEGVIAGFDYDDDSEDIDECRRAGYLAGQRLARIAGVSNG